ncbi:CLUMA_CG015850, isoform A [Clunio marinus]|uniref:b(0,+)-type amino acid transporter 1 n=1 Tax=Clunio marinus TaxID=568069 RepID=A0A1J1IUV0_9DIPT|nr:CLUMA_CG015850, isoform A [Clunio marinus]
MGKMEKDEDNGKSVGLKREMGLIAAVNVILGVMIGSGIFVSPQAALRYSGSIGACIVVWTVCGFISLIGALCFAELGTVVPKSGAEYAYLMEAFGKRHRFFGPLPAFLCAWVYVMVLRPAEIAVIILTFAEYSIQPLNSLPNMSQLSESDLRNITKLVALLALGIITYINLVSVKLFVKINNIFGVCKVLACLIVIFGGIYEIAIGNTQNLKSGFEGTNFNFGHIALAFYSGLWSYDGWSSVTAITEEIKRPEKNIPRSILIAVPIVTGLYVFMNIAYMTVMEKTEMINSIAVGITFGERVLGSFSFLIPLGVALSTFGCALSIQFGVTRLCFVSARENHMPKVLSYVHVTRSTPAPAVFLQGMLALIFLVVGDIAPLIEFASFLIWFFYGTAMLALLMMRVTHANTHRPYKVPIILPIFTLFVSLFLVITPMVSEPDVKYFSACGFILLGIAVYIPLVYMKMRPRLMDKITHLTQLFFLAAPTSMEVEEKVL